MGMLMLFLLCPSLKIKGKSISTFYWPPLLGLLVLLFSGILPFGEYWAGLTKSGTMNPLQICVLFFSTALISTALDEVGFFSFLAAKAAQKAKGSQTLLFLLLYALCAFLTMFTSNDIVIITFTPFILFFAKEAKVSPVPFLLCEFVSANTWSMIFVFGNPTNVYLSSLFGLDFVSYFLKMWLPALSSGLISLGIMLALFHKQLRGKMEVCSEQGEIKNKAVLAIALTLLSLVTILMAISGYLNLPMWLFALCGALVLVLLLPFIGIKKKEGMTILGRSFLRLPYSLAPFLLSMFGVVMAFTKVGITGQFAECLSRFHPIYGYGFASFLSCNVMNNLPMSVLFGEILSVSEIGMDSVCATIISSNLGAILSPIGALTGVMWMKMVKEHDVPFSFGRFCLYGAIISIPSLLAALTCLLVI